MKDFKKWFLTVAVLSAVLAVTAAYLSWKAFPPETSSRDTPVNTQLALYPAVKVVQMTDASRGFGPVMEATLPAVRNDGETEMLNLESGRWLPAPRLEQFNDDARALVTWIRTNGVNISGHILPNGLAACTTYNMAVVPLETNSWETTSAEEIPALSFLVANQHSPRRLLILAGDRPKIYAFRTDDGTFGMLRLVGLSDDRQEVKIRYKLVQVHEELAQPIAAK